MKNRTRWISFLLVLVMMISLLPLMSIEADAATRELWLWPVAEELVIYSNFGHREGYSNHKGIDISPLKWKCISDPGVAVRATKGGVIVDFCNSYGEKEFRKGSFGNYIKIRHDDGTYSLYAHLKPTLVKTNGRVEKGETIAYIGASGEAYGWHLHFEIYDGANRENNLLNPMPTEENATELGITIQNRYYGPDSGYWVTSFREETKIRQIYTMTPCNHHYGNYGLCDATPGCTAEYPFQDTSNYEDGGLYLVTSNTTYMKSKPYADKTNEHSATIGSTIRKNTTLKVLYSVKNSFGNKWYYVSGYNGYTGYVYSGDCEKNGCLPPIRVSFSNTITQPFDYTENRNQFINLTSGVITAENGNIASVQAYFFRDGTDGSQESNRIGRTALVAVNENSFTIHKDSLINKQLVFGDLSAGTYHYGIEAIDSAGKKWCWASNAFTVYPKAQPVVTNCDLSFAEAVAVDGGIRATISSATPGANVSVTPTNRIVQNDGNRVIVELPYSQTVYATASANGYKTVSGSKTYHVGSCHVPALHTNETPNGTIVTLTCPTNGAEICYSLDGVTFETYRQPFTLTKTQTVYAYAKKAGCTTSEWMQQAVTVTAPNAPQITTGALGNDVAVGTVIAVSWPQVRNASEYEVTICVDGTDQTQTVTLPQVSITAETAGTYQFRVRAKNSMGSSTESNLISVTAHEPLTVQFVNYDRSVLTEQLVPWGSSATAPSVPQRRGYTFAGWDQSFKKVTENLTVTAQWEIKTYTVKFYDYDGETLRHTQKIRFGSGIDSEAACASLDEKEGFVFTGWRVVSADADSLMDAQCVDSNMSLVAVRQWGKTELPVIISNVSAIRNEEATAYEVTYDITTAPRAELGGDTVGVKVLAVLKSRQTGESCETIYKTLALATDSVMLQEDTQKQTGKSITITLGNQGSNTKADIVEVYALALDGADRTGGALSEVATATPEITQVWSEWSDTKPTGVADEALRTRTVYRYRDNSKQTTSTTTCKETQTSLSGWEYERSREYWGDSFTSYVKLPDDPAVKEVGQTQVLQRSAYTQYRYGRWTNGVYNSFCPSVGLSNYGGTWRTEYTAWSNTPYKSCGNDFYCSGRTHNHVQRAYQDSYGDNWHVYSSDGAYSQAGRWFWEETQTVTASYRTLYTYQYKYYENIFYKWNEGNWSEWSAEPVTAIKDSRDVETKTQYSYVTNDTTQVADNSGMEYSISGSLPLGEGLEGKLATVLVYKTRNTDPTEAQLEYAEQITLGENASYALTFKNREDPSEYTGDYTVAMAVQGGSNLINVAQIRYDAEYTVTFTDGNGHKLGEQTVRRGQDAASPQPPEKAGFRFVKWDTPLTDVQSNMEITPVWMPETWSVVFVDHVNQTVEMQNGLETGTLLQLPSVTEKEGFVFNGWCVSRNDGSEIKTKDAITVDANLIAVANWERQTYTVTFMNADGSAVSTQNVAHGDAAVPPERITVGDGKVFVGWSSESAWWSVEGDMNVLPIVAYEATTAAPASNMDGYDSGISRRLVLSAEENATIYYTTDGSDPSIFDRKDRKMYQYEEPIELTKDTTIKAMAVSGNKNESEIIEINFVYQQTAHDEQKEQMIPLQTANVIVEPAQTVELQVNLQDTPGLLSYQLVLQADPSVFGVPCDENGTMLLAQPLNGENGDILVTPYDPELGGWMIFWYSTEACEGNGPLLRLTLKTLEDTIAGTYPVKLSYIAENTVTEAYVSAPLEQDMLQLSVSEAERLGDVSGDGLITAIDVIRIAKYVIGDYSFSATQLAAADVTGDGKVNAADVIRLARYLVGLAELE